MGTEEFDPSAIVKLESQVHRDANLLAKAPDDRYQSFGDVSVEVRWLRDVTSGWDGVSAESVPGPWQLVSPPPVANSGTLPRGIYRTGLQLAHDVPHRLMQPEGRRWYAQMLFDRNAAGDRDKARTLLGEAVEMYQTIGMPKHLEMVEKMSAAL